MLNALRRLAAACLLSGLGLVAACETAPAPPRFAEPSYADRGAFDLAVSDVAVEVSYVPPLREPNVEHRFPVSLAGAAERWARERLRATGGAEFLRFDITDASVVEEPLPVKEGLEGAVTVDQERRYRGRLAVLLEAVAEIGGRMAYVEVEVTMSKTVPEGLTVNERDRIFHGMVLGMMDQLDAQLDEQIPRYFGSYLH